MNNETIRLLYLLSAAGITLAATVVGWVLGRTLR